MLVVRSLTTAAYAPRLDSRGVQYRDAKLDIAYTVHSRELPQTPPSAKRFNMLFVHGAQFAKEGWYYTIEKCFEQWGSKLDKCVALDHVNHGESARLNEGKVGFYVLWEDLGRDIGCVIRECIRKGEFHRDAPLIVVAHSMGATASMALSVFDPGLISALVVIDPTWMGPNLPLASADAISGRFARMSYASYKRTRDTFKDLEDYQEYMKTKSVFANLHPRIQKDLIDNAYISIPNGGGVRSKASRALQAGTYYSGLSAIGVGDSIVRRVIQPTMIIHGDIADFNPAGLNEELEEILPHAERAEIKGEGHLVCYTKPDEVFEAFKDFVSREVKNSFDNYDRIEATWGPSVEERYLNQIDRSNKGERSAAFSKL